MADFSAPFYDRMLADAALMALLGSGTLSIITGEQIPPLTDSRWPLVHAYGFSSFLDQGTKNKGGVKFTKDLLVMSRETSSSTQVEGIAQRLFFLFNRQPFAITGYNVIVVEANGPRDMPSDENISAMVVSVTVHAMEV